MSNDQQKKLVSPEKLAANRKNAQRSSGPKTPAGKNRSAQNSYQHGFFATRLYPSQAFIDYDWADYQRILHAYWDHYAPVGHLEQLCIEKMAVESLRLSRLLAHEQKVLGWSSPFESRSIDRIMRYESSVSRQLEKVIAQLERLQEQRKAQSSEFEASEFQADDATEKTSETSSASESSTTERQDAEPSVKQAAPSNEPTETSASSPPLPGNSVTSTAQTMTTEQTMEQQPTNGVGSVETDETAIGSSRWIETTEDEKFVERLKKDLEL